MNNRISQRITCAALVAALVFNWIAPVPILEQDVQDMRYGRAHAAIPVAVIAATALAACGVYIAGYTMTEYYGNLEAVTNDFVNYAADQLGSTAEGVQEVLSSAVTTAGSIRLGTLVDAGILGLVSGFASGLVSGGTAVQGSASSASVPTKLTALTFNGFTLPLSSDVPPSKMRSSVLSNPVVWFTGPTNYYWHFTTPDATWSARTTWPSGNNQQRVQDIFCGTGFTSNAGTETVSGFYLNYYFGNLSRYTYIPYMDNVEVDPNNDVALGYDTASSWVTRPVLGDDFKAAYKSESTRYRISLNQMANSGYRIHFNANIPFTFWQNNKAVAYIYGGEVTLTEYGETLNAMLGEQSVAGSPVVVEPSTYAGTASLPTQDVDAFTPTQALLESGYSKLDVLDAEVAKANREISAIEASIQQVLDKLDSLEVGSGTVTVDNSEVLSGIDGLNARMTALDADVTSLDTGIGTVNDSLLDIIDTLAPWADSATGILALLNPVAAILTACDAIASGVASLVSVATGIEASPFDWLDGWWSTLTGWWSTLLTWLAAFDAANWWGTLSGWWEGLLDWAGDTPVGALVGDIAGAIDGVNVGVDGVAAGVDAGAADIVAAVEGIAVSGTSVEPFNPGTGGGSFALPDQARTQLDATLDQKAPFCYVRRLQGVEREVADSIGGASTWYVDIPIPYAGDVHFDAGMIMNQSYNGRTLAWYMRLMLTSLLCAGLIALSVRVSLSVLGVGGGKGD